MLNHTIESRVATLRPDEMQTRAPQAGAQGSVRKRSKTVRATAIRAVFALGLALGAATTLTATTSIATAPQAQAFGLGDIGGAIKSVGKELSRAGKEFGKTVSRDVKRAGKAVSGGAKNIGKELSRAGKDFGKTVARDVKRAGKAIDRGGRRVERNAKDWGTSAGAGIKDLAIGAKNIGRSALECFGKCRIESPTFVDDPEAKSRPGRLNGKNGRRSAKALPASRQSTSTKRAPAGGLKKSNGRGTANIARDRSVFGRPVGTARRNLKSNGQRKTLKHTREVRLPNPGRKVQGITRNNLKPSRKAKGFATKDVKLRRGSNRLRIQTKRTGNRVAEKRGNNRRNLRTGGRSSRHVEKRRNSVSKTNRSGRRR